MILTAHQPVYLPWLGLFHKIAIADLFCYFDIVQYQRKDYNNRNKIKTSNGELWLSVPVESKGHLNKNVSDILIIQDHWVQKHIRSIELNYKKTPFYLDYFPGLQEILINQSKSSLGILNLKLLEYFMNCLGIKTPLVKASDYDFNGIGSDLVLDMCIKLGADKYIFGAQGKNYANTNSFMKSNIQVEFQNYIHPVYSQIGRDFVPYMSIIDLLFNEGEQSFEILMSNNIGSL
tara:strand:- start:5183 stop:5881 length:699 start_codon:yes stop_codon:yes gene_type:complete